MSPAPPPVPKRIFIVPFSHLDLFWAGTRSECLSRGVTIIKTALDLLERHPDYRFMIEATNFLEHFFDACPGEKLRVRSLVETGRLEVIPMRSLVLTHLPSGETLVRNLLYGREFCLRELGRAGRVASLSDIPGVTPQMPQIAARAGLEALFLSHGCPPHTDHIVYEALDGTRIKSYAPIHYAQCRGLLADGEDYEAMLAREKEFAAFFAGTGYDIVCQWGLDLCVVGEHVVENIRRWNREGHATLQFCTLGEFFAQHYPDKPRRIAGEIPSLWPNIESTWPDIWPLDLPGEQALFNAELFEVLSGEHLHRPTLRTAWDWLLDGMDHNQNGIGGEEADRDKRDLKVAARLAAEQVTKRLAWALASQATAPRPGACPIVVFNPLSWRRTERIRARTALYGPGNARRADMHENYACFRLIDAGGRQVPFRTVTHRAMIADTIEVEFQAEDVPAFGAKVYYLEPVARAAVASPFTVKDGRKRDQSAPQLQAGISSVENALLRLEIDRVTGEFTLIDKRCGRTVLTRAGLLAFEEKRGDYICNMDLTGRIIPAVLETLELIDHSPVAYRVRLSGSVYGQRYVQTLTLDAASPTLEIENEIDWRGGCYARFEQVFPFASKEETETHYGVPFGSVRYPDTIYSGELSFKDLVTPERGDNPDDAITRIRLVSKWIAVKDSKTALTIGTGNRMWELDGNTVRNCMFRSIGSTSGGSILHEDGTKSGVHRPPAGTYTFRYKLSVQDADSPLAGHTGWELNAPLLPVGVGRSVVAASAGLELPVMPDTTGTSIIICNVKPAEEDPRDAIFRCFETAGRGQTLALPDVPGRAWLETDLMEEESAPVRGGEITLRPFEIKTLMWQRKQAP